MSYFVEKKKLDFSFHAVLLFPPGDLDNLKKNPFVLKEGVDYRIKINFKVRERGLCLRVLKAWRSPHL